MINRNVIDLIIAARYQFKIADRSARSTTRHKRFAAISNLQDAVELFLIAIITHLGGDVKPKSSFSDYISEITNVISKNQNLEKYKFPYKGMLIGMNDSRISSKHKGNVIDRGVLDTYISDVEKFFEDMSIQIFGKNFYIISLSMTVKNEEIRFALVKAEELYSTGNYKGSLSECRKAIFLSIEHRYDVRKYGLDGMYEVVRRLNPSYAPEWAKEKSFIEKWVQTPFDYIVYDEQDLERFLIHSGIPLSEYKSVTDITPEVYRDIDGWLVKDIYISPDVNLKSRAENAIEATINIVTLVEDYQNRSKREYRGDKCVYVKVKSHPVRIFSKASENSDALFIVDQNYHFIPIIAITPGLKCQKSFGVVQLSYNPNIEYTFGFVSENDVDLTDTSRIEPGIGITTIGPVK